VAWARNHAAFAAGASVVVVVGLLVAVALVVGATSGGSSGATVASGSIVGSGPLTTGYRLSGTLKARTPASVTLSITAVDYAAPQARNVVLFEGQVIQFIQPAQGVVAVARNGHRVSGPEKLHVGDKVTLVGEFTSVAAPPAPAHDGYSFFGLEAASR
jgi:hypothetical protein